MCFWFIVRVGFWFFMRRRGLNRTCALAKMMMGILMKVFRLRLNFSEFF